MRVSCTVVVIRLAIRLIQIPKVSRLKLLKRLFILEKGGLLNLVSSINPETWKFASLLGAKGKSVIIPSICLETKYEEPLVG